MRKTLLFWLAAWAVAFGPKPPLQAQDVLGCVEDLALPGFAGYLKVPGVFDVYFTIGADGRAAAERFSTDDPMTSAYLRAYFVSQSTYSKGCRGRQMHFVVTYIEQGVATGEPRYDTRWRAPNQIIVTYHPLKPTVN